MRTVTITISEDLFAKIVQAMARLGEVDRNRFLAGLLREGLLRLEGYRLALVVAVRDCRSRPPHVGRAAARIYLDERLCAEVVLVDGGAEEAAKIARGAKRVKVVPLA